MTITAEPPLVDTVSSAVTSNYDADFVDALPTRNNFYDIVALSPTVSAPNEGSGLFSLRRQRDVAAVEHRRLNLASPRAAGWAGASTPRSWRRRRSRGSGPVPSTQHDGQHLQPGDQVRQQHVPRIDRRYWTDNSLVDPNVTLDESELWDYRLWDPPASTRSTSTTTPAPPWPGRSSRTSCGSSSAPSGTASTSWVPTACRASKAAARPTTATTSSSPPSSATTTASTSADTPRPPT